MTISKSRDIVNKQSHNVFSISSEKQGEKLGNCSFSAFRLFIYFQKNSEQRRRYEMGKFPKMTSKSGIVFFLILAFSSPARGEVLWNFDVLPPTAHTDIPGSAGWYLYTSNDTNSDGIYSMTAYDLSGWRKTVGDPREASPKDYGSQRTISGNSPNIRFENVGHSEIDKTTAITEITERYPIAAGKNSGITPGRKSLTSS